MKYNVGWKTDTCYTCTWDYWVAEWVPGKTNCRQISHSKSKCPNAQKN